MLEVPDPEEGFAQRKYQILLKSTSGPIDVYLVSRFEEKYEGAAPSQAGQPDQQQPQQQQGQPQQPSYSQTPNQAYTTPAVLDTPGGAGAAAGAAGAGAGAVAGAGTGYTPGGGAGGAGGEGGAAGAGAGRAGEAQSGIVRLTPAESHDYWLLPDQQLGLTDMWRPDGPHSSEPLGCRHAWGRQHPTSHPFSFFDSLCSSQPPFHYPGPWEDPTRLNASDAGMPGGGGIPHAFETPPHTSTLPSIH
ncbi:unnamed protein product [Closterium sp. NIES-64]|nr:unnamed protein product [Closterium sp. NIES-64]